MSDKKMDGNAINILEKCSLLVDGELSEKEMDDILALYGQDGCVGEHVQTYHLIGDVLRSADFADSYVALGQHFDRAAFRERLSQEPLILAPVDLPRKKLQGKGKGKGLYLRWPHWAGLAAASVAIVSLVSVVNVSEEVIASEISQTTLTAASLQDGADRMLLRQKIRAANQTTMAALSSVNSAFQENKGFTPRYYMAAHRQFGYDSIVNRGYQAQVVQTTASK